MESELMGLIKKFPTWKEAKDGSLNTFSSTLICYLAYLFAWSICVPVMIIIDIRQCYWFLKSILN